jgi:hypothetical protein
LGHSNERIRRQSRRAPSTHASDIGKAANGVGAISKSIAANGGFSPDVSQTAKIMRDNGLEHLPFETIANLVEAVLSSVHKDGMDLVVDELYGRLCLG